MFQILLDPFFWGHPDLDPDLVKNKSGSEFLVFSPVNLTFSFRIRFFKTGSGKNGTGSTTLVSSNKNK